MAKRVFVLVLDSLGIGEDDKAKLYGDEGSNTLKSIYGSKEFKADFLTKMGLFNIDKNNYSKAERKPIASYGRLVEKSVGKDSITGHFELMGVILKKALPIFYNGFPEDLIKKLENAWGKKIICNKPYSGTDVIKDYGKKHIESGDVIVYTSADSVLQIACHEDIVALDELYKMCEQAREICRGDYEIARIIARPFVGKFPDFERTPNRKDYSIDPPSETTLDRLKSKGFDVISVGKIASLFNHRGVTQEYPTKSDLMGMDKMIEIAKTDFNGLCFVNLVNFDMLYGHRNDVDGYAKNLAEVDAKIEEFVSVLKDEDLFIITADHGCDPATKSTDHSRENVPFIVYQKNKKSKNLGTKKGFDNVGKTVEKYLYEGEI